MSHELIRLTSKLCNTPLLMTSDYLEKVMSVLSARNNGELAVGDLLNPRKRDLQYFPDKGLGIVDIHGGISDIPYEGLCGESGVSHQAIREQVAQLIDKGAKVIVLDQDSSGGIAHMAFESADYIRNLADANDVKLISYISSESFSASYVYSAVAHEVVINPSAEAGSIGVRVHLRNINGVMKNMGIEDIYVTAGEGKVPFNSEGKFTQEFLDDVQESVLETYSQFTGHVAMWRGLSVDQTVALGAKTYTAKKAISNGLVDKIMTLEEFKSYLESLTSSNTKSGGVMGNPISNLFKSKEKDTQMSTKTGESLSLQASLEAMQAEFTNKMATLEADFTSKFSLQAAELVQRESELATALAQLAAKAEADKKLVADARVAKLSAIVGDVEAPKLAASLEVLSDDAFDSAVSVLSAKSAQADQSILMSEVGDEGEAVVQEEVPHAKAVASSMEAYLKKQYNK